MRYFLSLLIFCCSIAGFCQSTFSIGPEIGLLTNYNRTKVGPGVSMEFDGHFTRGVGARLSLGYDRFTFNGIEKYHVDYIPVRAGVQGYLGKLFFIYGEGGIAAINSTNSNDSRFSYAIGGGYNAPFGMKQNLIQVSAFYNSVGIGKNSFEHWINIRMAYGLSFHHKAAPIKQ